MVTRNFNPMMAAAADVTIEAKKVVPVGRLIPMMSLSLSVCELLWRIANDG